MNQLPCSLLGLGGEDRHLGIDDYSKDVARWCPGCGDHAVLGAVRRLCEAEQLRPERTVFASGIGCSSRFPHYMKTYGFHGLHGRALPIALGIKLGRPDLVVFAVMGDGDCCSIGAGHWVHTVRYNPDLVAILLDNGVYGLTKNQTSPTSPRGLPSNTQPAGAHLEPLDPLAVTLGVRGASFVAQTCDWLPAHLDAVLAAAYRHRGFSFVRVLQRCPEYTDGLFTPVMRDPDGTEFLVHPDGVDLPGRHVLQHDPRDLQRARQLARPGDKLRLGVFYRDDTVPVYEAVRAVPPVGAAERLARLDEELDRHAI